MEQYRIRPVKSGKSVRMSYSRQKEVLEMPNLIEIQKDSYKWFLTDGLKEVFNDISPIEDFTEHLSLEFVDFQLCEDEAKYSIEECKERDATYAAPLKVKVRLNKKETGEISEHEIFMGDLPLMTATGTFVINGAERVIVSQLVRSPGIYYGIAHDKLGKELYSCTVIPNRGAWLEYETDSNDVFYVRVDRTRKVPVTVLIRALGYGTNAEIIDLFGEEPKILASFTKDTSDNYQDGLLELYKKIRPGEPLAVESAESLISSMFFDARRYDLAKVGRYKFNKKLALKNRIKGHILSEEVIDVNTGEVLAEAGTTVTEELAVKIQNAAVPYVMIQGEERNVKVISNMMVDINAYVDFDCTELGVTEDVFYPVLAQILSENETEEDLKDAIKRNINELIPKHITKEDIIASINYNMHLEADIGTSDDIDHLGNRRIRAVGELLQNQYRIGLSRMERVVRERMTTQDMADISPQALINIKPVTAAVKEFFGSSQLSQFMDQNNPLGELTHKRRLSALGPGGLSRDRAGFEVRDVHYSHYGRMCPIETPEGPNIGLINSLATYARINEYGFIEAPYRKLDKTDPLNPVVTDEVVYLTADEEDNYVVAQANEPLDADGHFVNTNISGRYREETSEFQKKVVDLMDVSPKMVFSVATSMIPFLENDDANRALMGSNMQRQAVPLLTTEAPVVGTGIEHKAAVDSGVCVLAKRAGTIERSTSKDITIRYDDDKSLETYKLIKFSRSNQSNCYNQKPIVFKGEHVEAGQVIADGASTANGEIALGKNPLIGFMTWEGYNYEDAVLLSEKLVQNDVYTSVHIEEYEAESRDTKLGPEEITRDVPGVGDDALKNLDERGIIRIGAEVRAGDILVGKVTPKGETELTAEERLLRAIFGEKAREVRDTSLKVPHGEYGIVVDAKVFTRENGDELAPGVNQTVRIYIAQKRKISVGDKMAGRHGNKGVVSRILPVEDMPFLPNGRPLDIVLNPLGVPSRMNIGQVLEIHLSLAAKALGFNISTPVFDGAKENDIMDTLDMANDYVNTTWEEFEAKYKDTVDPEIMQYLYDNRAHREEWKGVPISRDGKVQLRDGRTGEFFDGKVTIGHMHYLKLHHLVDDKIHARSTGPYSLVTQQPLGGKAQFGGQRFGEMEVWALEAYGASYTLQEILTVKSDDVVGRVKTYEAIIKGLNIPEPGIPESFKVLLKELQSLALDVKVLREDNTEVEMKENVDEASISYNSVMSDDNRNYNQGNEDFAKMGYQEQRIGDDGIEDVEAEENEDIMIEESDDDSYDAE
ncbi:DNA-directed RNA polymerase subunit beta [Bovifimicola ammoniilytica]|uniref:DNA-directed RNA polymerase subunit beta n=1 Tax=Bovifimicola ammoniilytica TaxID=2981720 RepID=UPI00033C27FA|nr:DNA-directed RNA polymerase subunit beta [Bovifimicola ammoniilytica]MCU6753638.1 DNA-directed RNA polymerase subunit beta [Bovifimicola ammoniilytica]CCZ04061.1 dNA-directed RNA polymerase subunit beta [Eubacterium sp. CAG:603]SCJ68449.1 DNA-directed RNA polymerase subunit beta [uncultured Eubacterium sp.]